MSPPRNWVVGAVPLSGGGHSVSGSGCPLIGWWVWLTSSGTYPPRSRAGNHAVAGGSGRATPACVRPTGGTSSYSPRSGVGSHRYPCPCPGLEPRTRIERQPNRGRRQWGAGAPRSPELVHAGRRPLTGPSETGSKDPKGGVYRYGRPPSRQYRGRAAVRFTWECGRIVTPAK